MIFLISTMRRSEKEIKERDEIEDIIRRAEICRIAFSVDDQPYIVPVNFGYNNNCLFIHSAREGKKIDMIKRNSRVSFEMEIDTSVIIEDTACDCRTKYRSVIGTGRAYLIDDPQGKREGLDILMAHYSDKPYKYPDNRIAGMLIIKIEIDSLTGKKA